MSANIYRTIKDKGVTAPKGFAAGAICSGIKNKLPDISLIASEVPAVAAGVFTRNAVKAAPVLLSMANIKDGRAQAIVANSGCANCCTGEQGTANAQAIAAAVAYELNMPQQYVLTASTGKIGNQMPMDSILPAIPKLVNALETDEGGVIAAEGIMTTDTVSKHTALSYKEGDDTVKVGGICKGAGMICPDMATMLCFITTDCKVSDEMLHKALSEAVSISFNRINIDGDMSTNDTVIALANGQAGNKEIKTTGAAFNRLKEALVKVCDILARMIVADGEGATKTLEIIVSGARSNGSAETIARKISNSILFRSAMSVGAPIWGRLMAAMGCVEQNIDQTKMNIKIGGIKVFEAGVPSSFDKTAAQAKLDKADTVKVEIDMGIGKGTATVLTSDLTPEYVVINQS